MKNLKDIRPVWLEINLDNIANNVKEIRRIIGDNTMIMASTKANAYGHGAIEVARTFIENGVDRLAVSIIQEAIELRKSSILAPILILSYTPMYQMDKIIEYDLIQTIYNYNDAVHLSSLASNKGKMVKIHIKIDTGMGRIGFLPNEESIKEILKISKLSNLEIEGIYSHFSSADEFDKTFTNLQFNRFMNVINRLKDEGLNIPIKHISNSGAILDLPDYNLDMIRPGIILYGYYPSDEVNKNIIDIKPAITLKSKVSNIKKVPANTGISYGQTFFTSRESVIATIPIGYADGYSRMLSGKTFVYVNGWKVPVVGRICMDQMMIDVTDIDEVNIGDEVILFGYGNGYPQIEELASLLGTVNYEILCMMSRRIPRVYIKNNEIVSINDYLLD